MMLERGPWENRFRGHRWNCLSLMGPMWVGTKGAPSSTVGVACCRRVPPVATFRNEYDQCDQFITKVQQIDGLHRVIIKGKIGSMK